MIFATVAIGESRRSDLMHLLNDIRNLGQKIYVYTDLYIDVQKFMFDNVTVIQAKNNEWTCFRKFELFKYIFLNTNETYIYYLDCDSRLFDFREEKYNQERFNEFINSLEFDILCTWMLGNIVNVKWHLTPPSPEENKLIRNQTHGHEEILTYLKSKIFDFEKVIEKEVILEGALIIKKSNKMIDYLQELITFGELMERCDEKINRLHKASASGFAMVLFSEQHSIDIQQNFATGNFFKPNFLNEVFLWGMNMEKQFKLLNK